MKKILYLVQLCFLTAVIACHTIQTTRVDNTPSERQSVYEDLNTPGAIQGVGIESQDIASMTDKMMRDMLATPSLTNRSIAPRVIIDDEYFVNESSSTINKKMIIERLMVNLNRASSGRMVFLERAAAEMVENERTLKRQGVLSQGSMGNAIAPAGADFRLSGRIMSLDTKAYSTGKVSRFHEISFKMVDLETGAVVWSGLYEFKKSSYDDVIYR